jgi:hypothetical protein
MVSAVPKMLQNSQGKHLMHKRYITSSILAGLLLLPDISFAAIDSYRFFHVTIETPYMIFLFLVGFVLAPFFLMAILYWRFAGRNPGDSDDTKTEDKE